MTWLKERRRMNWHWWDKTPTEGKNNTFRTDMQRESTFHQRKIVRFHKYCVRELKKMSDKVSSDRNRIVSIDLLNCNIWKQVDVWRGERKRRRVLQDIAELGITIFIHTYALSSTTVSSVAPQFYATNSYKYKTTLHSNTIMTWKNLGEIPHVRWTCE